MYFLDIITYGNGSVIASIPALAINRFSVPIKVAVYFVVIPPASPPNIPPRPIIL